jgi:trans-aconitate methyltransferase
MSASNSHFAYVEKVPDAEALCELAALLALRCGLDVLVGREVVHYQRYFVRAEYPAETRCFKFVYSYRRVMVVAEPRSSLRG